MATAMLQRSTVTLVLVLLWLAVNVQGQVKSTVEQKVMDLIVQLYSNPWRGPERQSISPTLWNFNLTKPMRGILDLGSASREELLNYLSDSRIKDQVIFLLGGVGDEYVIDSIIEAMIDKSQMENTPNADRINLIANLALTNITVADVVWPHGGGTVFELCPDNPKDCWRKWWEKNKSTFTVKGITQSRNYGNYPNYGIYKRK